MKYNIFMKPNKKLLSLSILFCCGCLGAVAQNFPSTTFRGNSSSDAGKSMEVWNTNALADISQEGNLTIPVKADGSFDYSFSLSQPGYFTIGYNTIYVKPGDMVSIQIDNEDPTKSVIAGTHSSLNQYLSGNAYTHSGSYVAMMNREKLEDATYTDHFIDSVANARLAQLKAIKGADSTFVHAEKARIDADVINSYLSIPFYAGFEDDSTKYKTFMDARMNKISSLLKSICHDEYLDIENVRYVVQSCIQSPLFSSSIVWTPHLTDYVTSLYCSNLLDSKTDEATLNQVKSMIDSIKVTAFAQAVKGKLNKVMQLAKGKNAIDIQFTTLDGKQVKLSDYRGKAICIDFWATWCGPCMRESPLFHQLAEQYKQNKDIVFLAISIDTDFNQWKKRMAGKTHSIPELNCTDNEALGKWNINSIPRFIIIDKNFKILDANAPAPSEEGKLKECVNKVLEIK